MMVQTITMISNGGDRRAPAGGRTVVKGGALGFVTGRCGAELLAG